jgi:PPOX class probable F420-dependent enzyme
MQIPDDRVRALLRTWPVARLATLAPHGGPHLVPIVFAEFEGELWSPIDGKPKGSGALARVRHVEADPRVALLLDEYGSDWARLWWISLRARARLVAVRRGEPPFPALEDAFRQKYPQYGTTALFSGAPRCIAMRIERVRSWCAGPAALGRACAPP